MHLKKYLEKNVKHPNGEIIHEFKRRENVMKLISSPMSISVAVASMFGMYWMMNRDKPKCDIPSQDKVIVITGAAGGFGSLITRELIEKWKAKVIAIDCSLTVLEKVFEKELNGNSLQIIECDIRNNEQVESAGKLIKETIQKWNIDRVFALVNNAGVTSSPSTEKAAGLVEL